MTAVAVETDDVVRRFVEDLQRRRRDGMASLAGNQQPAAGGPQRVRGSPTSVSTLYLADASATSSGLASSTWDRDCRTVVTIEAASVSKWRRRLAEVSERP